MPRSYRRSLLIAMLTVGIVPAIVIAIVTWAVPRLAGDAQNSGPVLLFVVGLLVLSAAAFAWRMAAALAHPIARLRESAALMAGPNPGHRARLHADPTLEAIAGHLNTLAERAADAERLEQERLARATHALRVEKEIVTSVLLNLDVGLVVFNAERKIVLANPAARALLSTPAYPIRPGSDLMACLGASADAVLASDGGGDEGGSELAAQTTTLTTPGGQPIAASARSIPGPPAGHRVLIVRRADEVSGAPAEVSSQLAIRRQALENLGDEGFFQAWLPPADATPSTDAELTRLSFAVLDLETTGLEPVRDAIVSIASVRVRAGRVDRADRFCALVDPERSIPPAATRIHGIDDDAVRGMPPLPDVLPRLVAHVGESVLVGHVVAFDLAFLEPGLRALQLPSMRRHGVLDTLLLGLALFPSRPAATLEELADLLGVEVVGRHTAVGDALTTAECLAQMLVLLEQRGVRTLGDALALQSPSALRRALRAIVSAE